jgi:hypothetical protein
LQAESPEWQKSATFALIDTIKLPASSRQQGLDTVELGGELKA